jgi:hypothetical protein
VSGISTEKGLWIGVGASDGLKIALYKYDGTTKTVLGTTSSAQFIDNVTTEKRIDLQVTSYGASSTLNVYVNGGLVITYSGDCTVSGVTNLDCVGIRGYFGQFTGMSEFIVSSEDTRGYSLLTMAPTGAGTTGDWTGTYADIDEVTKDDADVVYTDTVTQDEQYNATDPPSGSYSVPYVVVKARATKTVGATATKVGLGVNHGGTVDAGTLQSVTTGWETYERIMSQNPVTVADWESSQLAALQINLRSGS